MIIINFLQKTMEHFVVPTMKFDNMQTLQLFSVCGDRELAKWTNSSANVYVEQTELACPGRGTGTSRSGTENQPVSKLCWPLNGPASNTRLTASTENEQTAEPQKPPLRDRSKRTVYLTTKVRSIATGSCFRITRSQDLSTMNSAEISVGNIICQQYTK